MEMNALFALEQAEAGIVTLAELSKKLHLSKVQVWKLASRLVRKKRLIRIRRGIYLFAPLKAGKKGLWTESSLAAVPVIMKNKGYYVGFWAALNHYGLTEQMPVSVQIITKSRGRAFKALQSTFEFVEVRELGRWQEEKINDKSIRFATIEQLVCDCLTLPEKSGGIKEACKALWSAREKINWKIIQELKFTDAAWRRLGYLCELLDIGNIKAKKITGWRWLDPSSSKKILSKSKRWGLLLNVSEKELTEWREY